MNHSSALHVRRSRSPSIFPSSRDSQPSIATTFGGGFPGSPGTASAIRRQNLARSGGSPSIDTSRAYAKISVRHSCGAAQQ